MVSSFNWIEIHAKPTVINSIIHDSIVQNLFGEKPMKDLRRKCLIIFFYFEIFENGSLDKKKITREEDHHTFD